jgi:sterol 3beta-glucosyltransferase
MGESVKIAIPYSVIDGVEKSSAMDFSETIEVKVIDKEECNFTLDSYFFAYFRDLPAALTQIREVLVQYQATAPPPNEAQVTDTTQMHRAVNLNAQLNHLDRTTSAPPTAAADSSGGFRISSLLGRRPFSTTSTTDDINKSRTSESFTTSMSQSTDAVSHREPGSAETTQGTESTLSEVSIHTYPPSPSTIHPPSSSNRTSVSSAWSVPGYNWLRGKRLFSSPTSGVEWGSRSGDSNISEVISSPHADQSRLSMSTDGNNNLGFSMLEASEEGKAADAGMQEKFRTTFALDEKETLLGCEFLGRASLNYTDDGWLDTSGSLFRVLPVFGRLYVSTNYFCFRSSQPLTRTRVGIYAGCL